MVGGSIEDATGNKDRPLYDIDAAPVSRPIDFMAGIKGKSFSVAPPEAAGVRRIRLATSLYRAAMIGLIAAAREVREAGPSATSSATWARS